MSFTEESKANHVPLALSRHLMIEYYDCDRAVLNDVAKLEVTLLQAVKQSGATAIDSAFRSFEPQGISGFVMISESHFSIHTWPEFRYAAVDIFTCGDTVDCERAIAYLRTIFNSAQPIISGDTKRGIVTHQGISRAVPILSENQDQFSLSWKTAFEKSHARILQITLDVKNCCPKILRSPTTLRHFINTLCDHLGLSPSAECDIAAISDPQQAGFNVLQRIGLSSISAQILHDTNTCYIDIALCHYSEPRILAEFALNALQGSDYTLQLALRQ